jgi:hypothetical protein
MRTTKQSLGSLNHLEFLDRLWREARRNKKTRDKQEEKGFASRRIPNCPLNENSAVARMVARKIKHRSG